MKTLKEIIAASLRYDPDDPRRREAFIEGYRYAVTGKYYKEQKVDFSSPHVPTFDEWWNAYNLKKGRKKSEEKWNRLSDKDKVACMSATPAYVASTIKPGEPQSHQCYKPYRAHPLTYLNGARWEDEIIIPSDYEQQRTQRLAQRSARLITGAFGG